MHMGILYLISDRVTLSKDNVTMKDIKKTFPLEGKYIFRFKYKV